MAEDLLVDTVYKIAEIGNKTRKLGTCLLYPETTGYFFQLEMIIISAR